MRCCSTHTHYKAIDKALFVERCIDVKPTDKPRIVLQARFVYLCAMCVATAITLGAPRQRIVHIYWQERERERELTDRRSFWIIRVQHMQCCVIAVVVALEYHSKEQYQPANIDSHQTLDAQHIAPVQYFFFTYLSIWMNGHKYIIHSRSYNSFSIFSLCEIRCNNPIR